MSCPFIPFAAKGDELKSCLLRPLKFVSTKSFVQDHLCLLKFIPTNIES